MKFKSVFRFVSGALFGGVVVLGLIACSNIGNASSDGWGNTISIEDGTVHYSNPAIIKDNETGVEYIILSNQNSAGGTVITPRLDKDGKPYIK